MRLGPEIGVLSLTAYQACWITRFTCGVRERRRVPRKMCLKSWSDSGLGRPLLQQEVAMSNGLRRTLDRLRIVLAPDLPDEQLLAHFIASRDEAAFATLVRRHGHMVLGVSRRILGSLHDSEDVFQATFLVL